MKAGAWCGLLRLSKATPCLQHRKTKEKQILIHGAVTTYQMPEGVEHWKWGKWQVESGKRDYLSEAGRR